MSRRSRKKDRSVEYVDPELNIMPFIDIFSMLNTFLLFSAVFLSIGIIEIQVPFLSNAKPPKEDKPTRLIEVTVEIEKLELILITRFSSPPVNEEEKKFKMDEAGIAEFHTKLVELRTAHQDTDLVTVFTEDDVTYEQLTQVLDAIKIRKEGDPQFTETDQKSGEQRSTPFIYPKVVLGSVGL